MFDFECEECDADVHAVVVSDTIGHQDVVRLLLDQPSVAMKDLSPLAAIRQRRLQSPLSAVHWAADGGHSDCIRLLLASEQWRQLADRPTTDRRNMGHFTTAPGTTPLMLAARSGSVVVIREIVSVVGDDVLVVDRQNQDGQ